MMRKTKFIDIRVLGLENEAETLTTTLPAPCVERRATNPPFFLTSSREYDDEPPRSSSQYRLICGHSNIIIIVRPPIEITGGAHKIGFGPDFLTRGNALFPLVVGLSRTDVIFAIGLTT
ncbi:hypothetical protein OUZ56_031742 [Daphnia magna]|uniref:Uncharacterized protein n=1 Tax=Daphnia magna TaxID=35525 RepID=A0ABQ9ZV36_9CRUS|nr:hypothetical protein OUZ56_031742 [Daphnia magna]